MRGTTGVAGAKVREEECKHTNEGGLRGAAKSRGPRDGVWEGVRAQRRSPKRKGGT